MFRPAGTVSWSELRVLWTVNQWMNVWMLHPSTHSREILTNFVKTWALKACFSANRRSRFKICSTEYNKTIITYSGTNGWFNKDGLKILVSNKQMKMQRYFHMCFKMNCSISTFEGDKGAKIYTQQHGRSAIISKFSKKKSAIHIILVVSTYLV